MAIERLAELAAMVKATQDRIAAEAKDALKSAVAGFLESHPAVRSVGWKQWTPGFNDGEPCVNTLGELELRLFSAEGETEDEGYGRWSDGDDVPPEARDEFLELSRAVARLEGSWERIFGTNSSIVITREGVEVADYDCGY